jgi:HTH-type transcriptional regulator, competence development regulator
MPKKDTKNNSLKFGEFVRKTRLELNIGLRDFSRQVGVSAAYISKMEMDEFSPPKEENIKKMAKILKVDEDKLLSMADKISSDIKEIINDKPDLYAAFLRKAKPKDVEKYLKDLNKNG